MRRVPGFFGWLVYIVNMTDLLCNFLFYTEGTNNPQDTRSSSDGLLKTEVNKPLSQRRSPDGREFTEDCSHVEISSSTQSLCSSSEEQVCLCASQAIT